MAIRNVDVRYTGHHFTDRKEEVYFTAELDAPRVGHLTLHYIADRYMTRRYDGVGDRKGRDAWSDWRVKRSYSPDAGKQGIGPKTLSDASDAVEPLIMVWLKSDAYAPSRQKAVARWIAREARDTRYGSEHVRRTLAQYSAEVSDTDYARLSNALQHLDDANSALNEVEHD